MCQVFEVCFLLQTLVHCVYAAVSGSSGTEPIVPQSHHLPGRTIPTIQHISAKNESSLLFGSWPLCSIGCKANRNRESTDLQVRHSKGALCESSKETHTLDILKHPRSLNSILTAWLHRSWHK